MLREYEFTFIAKADLPEADKAKLFTKYETLLTEGGEMVKRDDWGVKRLSYPIAKQFRGHYMHFDFVGKIENLTECERLMRIDENILRFLSMRIGEDVNVEERRAELAKRTAARYEQKDRDADEMN